MFHFILASTISDEISAGIWIVSTYRKCCFSLSLCFHNLSLTSVFRSWTIMTWYGFFCFVLFSYLGFAQFLESVSSWIFTKFAEFSAIIYLSTFLAASSFFSPGISNHIDIKSFVILPQFLETVHVFESIFLKYSDWVIFIVFFLKVTDSVLYPLHFDIELILWFF